ncbi:symplekin isoform X1, partial [Tanacetum coccineum]
RLMYEYYYISSARSLAGSSTPPNRAYLWIPRSGPTSAMAVNNDDSSEDESSIEIPKTSPRPMPHSIGCNPVTRGYVIVTPAEHTSMPSPEDTIHLAKILGISNEEAGLKVDISKKDSKGTSGVSPLDSMSAKNKSIVNHTTRIEDIKANQPHEIYSLAYQPESNGRKLLALKFVESVTLLYTADPSASSEQPADQTSSYEFNIAWLRGCHPILNVGDLLVEAIRNQGQGLIFCNVVSDDIFAQNFDPQLLVKPSKSQRDAIVTALLQVASRLLRLVKDFVIRLTNVDCAFKEMECEIVKLEEDNHDLVLSIRKHEESQSSNSSSSKRNRTILKHLKVRLSSWRKKTESWYSLKKHEESQASLYSSIETLQHKLKTLEQIQFIATVLITVSQEKLNGT